MCVVGGGGGGGHLDGMGRQVKGQMNEKTGRIIPMSTVDYNNLSL